jgi:prephenate dehydratase
VISRKYFKDKVSNLVSLDAPSIGEACRRVEAGEVELALLPFENSSSGVLNDVFDLILAGSLILVGETTNIEEHCLCALPGTDLKSVRNVISHPHILNQCSNFVRQMASDCPEEIASTLFRDSASSCKKIHAESLKGTAAIASAAAAQLHNLEVLKQGIGDDKNNETRYLILSKADPEKSLKLLTEDFLHSSKRLKCSIAVSLKNETNALMKMVTCFALRELNIMKLESRPASSVFGNQSPGGEAVRHWDLLFFIEFEPAYTQTINKSLMENLEEFCVWIRELGTYEQTVKQSDIPFEQNDDMLRECLSANMY